MNTLHSEAATDLRQSAIYVKLVSPAPASHQDCETTLGVYTNWPPVQLAGAFGASIVTTAAGVSATLGSIEVAGNHYLTVQDPAHPSDYCIAYYYTGGAQTEAGSAASASWPVLDATGDHHTSPATCP